MNSVLSRLRFSLLLGIGCAWPCLALGDGLIDALVQRFARSEFEFMRAQSNAPLPPPAALSEARHGATDATYGYYTLGKLMILKLRDDYKAKQGAPWSLRGFHDAFLKLGPLPLPLIRKAMLGEVGESLPH